MRFRGGEAGAAIVEFAIVATILLPLLLGTISYGLILGLHQSITHAASEAARSAIATPTDDAAIQAVARQRLAWLPADRRLLVEVPPPQRGVDGCSNCISVTVTYPYAGNELIPSFLPVPAVLTSTAIVDLGDR